MITVKDTQRSTVRVSFDGQVIKQFHGPNARERFENETLILRHLESQHCPFVPHLIRADPETHIMVTTHCGSRVDHLDPERCQELFAQLEEYGVRHDDADIRNVTYRQQDGSFCLIDFEFATLLDPLQTAPASEQIPLTSIVPPSLSISWSGHTDQGIARQNNEDVFLGLSIDSKEVHHLGKIGQAPPEILRHSDLLFAVSDGMGGARSGEFASRIAVEKITRMLPPLLKQRSKGIAIGVKRTLSTLFAEIHKAMLYMGSSYDECKGMGATLSLCWFSGEVMHFAHLGDSRIYHLPATGGIRQLTEDDTYVGWLFRTGAINEREAKSHPRRNLLQKALGAESQFATPQIGSVPYSVGDRLIICSDGVTDAIYNAEIPSLLEECPSDATSAEYLVDQGIIRSGRDNATAMVLEVQ
jgi:serine/threonine protein phosphatase PrpC